MSLHSQIKESMKEALRSKDQIRLMTLRGLISAFNNELLSAPGGITEVSDEIALSVIKRQVKQRKEAIEQYQKGGRQDLADNESAELAVLEQYLPEMMPEDQIQAIIIDKKAELGVTSKADMGKLIGAVMKEVAGAADGDAVRKLVEASLG